MFSNMVVFTVLNLWVCCLITTQVHHCQAYHATDKFTFKFSSCREFYK